MEPPKTMPLPWVIASVADERCRTCVCIFDKDGLRFNGIAAIDQGDAAAYIQHCVNNYPALVEALQKLAKLGNGDQYGNSNGNVIAQDALRKAGELE